MCTSHVSDSIVRVPRDANTLRALAGDFSTSCLRQTYNQPLLFCEVVGNKFDPSVPHEQRLELDAPTGSDPDLDEGTEGADGEEPYDGRDETKEKVEDG